MTMTRRTALKTLSLGSAALASLPLAALSGAPAAASPAPGRFPFALPELPYAYDALADFVDPETMSLHHKKHHAGYVNNLNAALEKADPKWRASSLEELLANASRMEEPLKTAVINHGGGHANHTLFWSILSPEAGGRPEGRLADLIAGRFGTLEDCLAKLRAAALSVFGSGWAWLSLGEDGLIVETTPNQETPLMASRRPLLGIDVWEHAYYLKYQNRRADYVDNVLSHLNWPAIAAQAALT